MKGDEAAAGSLAATGARVAQSGAPLVINDISSAVGFEELTGDISSGSIAGFPVVHQGKLMCVICFYHPALAYFSANFLKALEPSMNVIGQVFRLSEMYVELGEANKSLEKLVEKKTSELLASKASLEETGEKLKRMNSLKDKFISNINHELRTPLTSIIGFSRMMLDFQGIDDEERRKYSRIIYNCGLSLQNTLNDAMDIARIESGSFSLSVELLNVNSIIAACVEEFRPLLEQKKQTLVTHLDVHAPKVYGDRGRLRQIVCNLIHNALKYTDREGTIEVLTKGLPQEIMVSVVDNGVGIEPSRQKGIFDRFSAHGPGDAFEAGLGLGLNLSRLLLELHGGKIWVESEPEKGSNFSFCIPRKMQCDLGKPKIRPIFG